MLLKKEETKTHNIYRLLFLKFKFRKPSNDNNNIFVVLENGERKKVEKINGLKVRFLGENSTIIVHSPIINFVDSYINCGNGAFIEIKSSKNIAKELKILATVDNVTCFIDEGFSCTRSCFILLHKEPNLKVAIGKDCMFGSNVVLRTTDAHPIYDKVTNELINPGGDVIIGNNVWLGMNVTVLKNTKIADGCVVGTCSVVTKDCLTPDSIYVGTPAKLIKQNIKWDRMFEET